MTAAHVRKRRRWLRRRALRGRRRPLPLRVVEVNGMAASQVAPERTARILRQAAGHADVLLVCEAFNLEVADALGDAWDVTQRGALGTSEATNAIAVRRSRGQILRDLGTTSAVGPSLGKRVAKALRPRSWVRALVVIDPGTPYVWRHRFSAGHAPPKRAWFLTTTYLALAPKRGSLGADWNRIRRYVAAAFPARTVRMVRLLGIAVPRWIPTTPATGIPVGGDHLAAQTTYWP